MVLRTAFVEQARTGKMPFSQVCRDYGISRTTGYKWLNRMASGEGLMERSRKPAYSPRKTADDVEAMVVKLRHQYGWGGRKINRVMHDQGCDAVPKPSTITKILHRHGLISAEASVKAKAWQRFEHPNPNDLWQMDFKGHFELVDHSRCHPLTVLDDHSRYNVCLKACVDEQGATVKTLLTKAFKHYGLPKRMSMDNGNPWGTSGQGINLTKLAVWLIRLGVRVSHSRPHHPQTQGKDERFHRSLSDEVIKRRTLRTVRHCQWHFDRWRRIYNHVRPHESLDLDTPTTRYTASERRFPGRLPVVIYPDDYQTRKVQKKGWISFKGEEQRISRALAGETVGLVPCETDDGAWQVYYCQQRITSLKVG